MFAASCRYAPQERYPLASPKQARVDEGGRSIPVVGHALEGIQRRQASELFRVTLPNAGLLKAFKNGRHCDVCDWVGAFTTRRQ